MQAAKINPKKIYALKVAGIVVRFNVDAVVTVNRRTHEKGSSADSTSYIEGAIHKADVPAGTIIEPSRAVSLNYDQDRFIPYRATVDQILGLHDEYEELKRRAAEEKAAKDAKDAAEEARARALRQELYRLVGSHQLPEEKDHHQLFRLTYSPGVEISRDGVAALAGVLLIKTKDAA